MSDFYIGSGDFFGENGPNEKFNKEIVPKLLKMGIKEKDLKEVTITNVLTDQMYILYQYSQQQSSSYILRKKILLVSALFASLFHQ